MHAKRELWPRRRRYTAVKHGKGALAVVVRAPQPASSKHLGRLLMYGQAYPCALGRSGITGMKREGDGATPRGTMAVLTGRYRADKVRRPWGAASFWAPIRASDGWCDAAFTPAYNTSVTLPHRQSHEVMTRQDHLYDRLLVLDWNIGTRAQGRGSAIFMHQARVEDRTLKPTEGCVALTTRVFARLAPHLARLQGVRVL